MTDLTGKQIANTYKQLLKVAVSTNSGVSTTAQTIQSGDGTNSAMQLSTTAIKSTSKIVGVSICATNDVHVGGNVCATAFFGDGSGLTNVSLSVSSSVAHFTANVLEVPACASITNLMAATGSFSTKVSGVTAQFSGNVCASEYYGDGSNLTNVSASSFATSVASFTVNQLGVVTAASITSLVAPHGSFTTKVSGVAAEFSGNVCAAEYYGDGSNLSGISSPTSVASFTVNQLGVVTAASITSLVAPHGSFTTKVSGVAGEFSGAVSVGGGLWTEGGAVFNEAGADVDFRVEAPGKTHMFFVDAGEDRIGIGSAAASGSPDSILHVEDAGFVKQKLETTGTSKQVDITFEAPTGSATHGLIFNIAASVRSAWYLQESAGTFDFRYGGGGTGDSYMKWSDTEVVFNDGSADLDFRVESDGNDKMLWVRADNNAVGIGTDPASTEILKVGTESGVDGTQYDILKLQGVGSGPLACIFRDDIGTSATTIMSVNVAGTGGGMCFITGGTDPHTFSEMVVFTNQGGYSVFGTTTKNSPPTRTYSVSGINLQLAYGSGTHKAAVWAICMRHN